MHFREQQVIERLIMGASTGEMGTVTEGASVGSRRWALHAVKKGSQPCPTVLSHCIPQHRSGVNKLLSYTV